MTSPLIWRSLRRLVLIALGIAIALAVVETGMRAAGLALRYAQTRRNQSALHRQHRVRIACVGESTTAGDGVNGRYPEMLEAILNQQDLGGKVAVANLGRAGAVSVNLVGAIADALPRLQPDLVVAMMGINDAGHTHSYGSLIAPGAGRWYGSFRLYKLYRVLRFAIARARTGSTPAAALVLGEGIATPPAAVDEAARAAWHDRHRQSAPRSQDVAARVADLEARVARRQWDGVENALRQLIDEDPGFAHLYALLADVERQSGRDDAAHDTLVRGVEAITGVSPGLYAALAESHFQRGAHQRAIAVQRRVLDEMIEPGNIGSRIHYTIGLADLYERAGRHAEAEKTWRHLAERVHPGNDVLYEHLIRYYDRTGSAEKAERSRELQRRIRYEYVNPVTRENYLTVRRELAARGIPLVALQYPGRDVETLRRMLDDDAGVTYVDNSSFRDLVAADGYERYFYDRFAGDFGHLTREGNCQLARNVARAITEQVFGLAFDESRAACAPAANGAGPLGRAPIGLPPDRPHLPRTGHTASQ
jgi:lysophospholipase L1-like esterase